MSKKFTLTIFVELDEPEARDHSFLPVTAGYPLMPDDGTINIQATIIGDVRKNGLCQLQRRFVTPYCIRDYKQFIGQMVRSSVMDMAASLLGGGEDK